MNCRGIFLPLLRNYKLNSIFFRMLAVCSTVFLVLCLLNFIGIRILATQAIENERSNSKFYMDYTYSYVQTLFNKLKDTMYILEHDKEIVLLRSLPATLGDSASYIHSYDAVANALSKLSLYSNSTSEVAKLYLFLPNIDRILTTGGVFTPRTFYANYGAGSYEQWHESLSGNHVYALRLWDYNANQSNFSRLNMVKTFYHGYDEKALVIATLDRNLICNLFDGTEFAAERTIYMTDGDRSITY